MNASYASTGKDQSVNLRATTNLTITVTWDSLIKEWS